MTFGDSLVVPIFLQSTDVPKGVKVVPINRIYKNGQSRLEYLIKIYRSQHKSGQPFYLQIRTPTD